MNLSAIGLFIHNNIKARTTQLTAWSSDLTQSSVPILERQSAAVFSRPGLKLNSTLNPHKANDHLVNFELLCAHSVRNVNGLWSEYNVISEPEIHCLKLSKTQIVAKASLLTVLQFCWVRDNLLLANAMGLSVPYWDVWDEKPATAKSLASTKILKGLLKLMIYSGSTVALHNKYSSVWNTY